ncbi:hypothetical protein [uncultured Thiocystis sp.]|jgi:hypothetical protein|uniref:hypothetical protein n=1 Tax=uncultured Thiocystis sp. TaxID=1202134 RepID=UPI0025DBA5F0|nr:hypothetical protein [uncultured Thiocystis sp.]
MTALTSGGDIRVLTANAGLPGSLRTRINQLGHLPAGLLHARVDTSVADLPTDIRLRWPTLTAVSSNGKALSFRRAAGASSPLTGLVTDQEFEGMVVSVAPKCDGFIARLADLTGHGPEEEAEIAFEEISPDDHPLIVPGALFTWTIGRMGTGSVQLCNINYIYQ